MAKKEQEKVTLGGLKIWKVIGVFALVFAAVQLAVTAFGVGINYLMKMINPGENVRVFFGTTISRIGMIAAILLITKPVIQAILNKPSLNTIYPFTKYWLKRLADRNVYFRARHADHFLDRISFRLDLYSRICAKGSSVGSLVADDLGFSFG